MEKVKTPMDSLPFEIKMSKEFLDKWTTALRSGEYQQGSGCLHDNDRYCCLGVACTISGIEKSIISPNNIYETGYIGDIKNEFLTTELLHSFVDNNKGKLFQHIVAGFNDGDVIYIDPDFSSISTVIKHDDAIVMNKDKNKYSFEEIADWLEENVTTS